MPGLTRLETYLAISDLERSDGRARRRAEQIEQLAELRQRSRIVDAGAGQGWYSLLFAEAHDVIGVDSSDWLIGRARERAARLRGAIAPRLVVTASDSLPVRDRSIDVALSLSGSIGHGTEEEDRAALDELRRVLVPNGRLVLETLHAESAELRPDHLAAFPAGTVVAYRPKFDRTTQTLTETQTLFQDGRQTGTFAYTMHMYDIEQLIELLLEAGFATPDLYGGTDGSALTRTSPVVLVARLRQPRFSAVLAG